MATRLRGARRVRQSGATTFFVLALLGAALVSPAPRATASGTQHATYGHGVLHELDCNGDSPIQKEFRPMSCTDIRGIEGVDNANTWGGRFYDNGVYIGRDEPDATFLSHVKGTGNDVTWNLTLGVDPAAAPTTTSPGHDVSHMFELTPALWLSMAICDGLSYPQLPCTPRSDANAPAPCSVPAAKCSANLYPGGGSALMELQLFPPGNPPFVDNVSCDGTHWCAGLTIDSLECTQDFVQCNGDCEEPVNFAFVETNGVPDPAGNIPDARTLLMNPGDHLSVHTSDARAGRGHALLVVIDDLTRHTSGSMQASAANGFVHTSIIDCSQSPYNFEPEYSTAAPGNVVPWAALQTNIGMAVETGHFEPCTKLTTPLLFATNPIDAADPNGTLSVCVGPYERAKTHGEGAEYSDAMCYAAGDRHRGYLGSGTITAPDLATGCQANVSQNGDLDFDGAAYWHEWPTGAAPGKRPGSFGVGIPAHGGTAFSQYYFQTDVALSESSCGARTPNRCSIVPPGPGGFYPFWSAIGANHACALEFGNVTSGSAVTSFGGSAQFGALQLVNLGYPEYVGPVHRAAC